ncbi:MAG: glycosyl transferase [Acidobacteria bacterium]|nr:glycosyl transferase [Acidobacteriota bacterium]
MSDFYQVGVFTTMHNLGMPEALERLEAELVTHGRQRPTALLLPALFSEFEGPAMPGIIAELAQVPYLKRIVVSLDRADRAQFDTARRAFDKVSTPVTVVWHDGPRLQALYREILANDLPIGEQGKGRSCWMTYGSIIGEADCQVIALHDSDIVTYDRSMLARLCYPVTNPTMGYMFAKGFYPRIGANRMHGRVTRLLMTPLIRSLTKILGAQPLLAYMDSFRYVLAGEFAMDVDLVRAVRIPGDWGLEVGMLGEVYRNTSLNRICQVGIADRYDHKHQQVSSGDPSAGLMKMTIDICKSLFRQLAAEGIELSSGTFRTLQAAYVRTAEDTLTRFHHDAMLNGLDFDRHAEETAVGAFVQAVQIASRQFLDDPLGIPLIPSWNRVVAAQSTIFEDLRDAVRADNA